MYNGAFSSNTCVLHFQIASQQSKVHKPKAAFGLSLKGISLYDETTKVQYQYSKIIN